MSGQLHPAIVARMVVIVASLITFSLICHRFWKLRHHFVIRARRPALSVLAASFVLLSNVPILIGGILDELNIQPKTAYFLVASTQSLGYLSVALIVYRLLYVYDDWISSTALFHERHGILVNSPESQAAYMLAIHSYTFCGCLALPKKATHRMLEIFLFAQFIFFSVAFQFDELLPVRLVNWCLFLLSAVVLLVKARRVKDNLACVYETYLGIALVIVIGCIALLFTSVMSIEWARFMTSICTVLASHVLIGFSLFMVWKTQKNSNKSGALNLSSTKLHEYLAKQENYEKFAEFLASAFALENLLYFVRVIRFRNALLSALNVTEDEWRPAGNQWTEVFSLKFEYFASVNLNENDVDEMIHAKASEIYNQFVCDDAAQQINISWENRANLHSFFAANRKKERSVPDYLMVFNDSVQEVYRSLVSLYQFQYKSS